MPPPGRDFGLVREVKQVLILSDAKLNCYDLEVVKQMAVQEHNMMTDKLIDLSALYFTYWTQYVDEVTVPMLCALGEHDWLWHGNKEHAQDFVVHFPNSARIEGIVASGSHTLEWWRGSRGWFARCFG
jgi:hypothetical protein